MSVLTIRAHKRYALRMPVELQRKGRKDASGLLIELSQEGARISNLGRGKYEAGDELVVVTPCGKELEATIRWSHDGIAGIRLDPALRLPEMSDLLHADRREREPADCRYGT